MKQIKLISKLGLAVIAITAISVAVAVHAFHYYHYFTQSSDAQAQLSQVLPNVPLNSVASENIIDGQVMTQDLANDNVTTAKIKNGEVKTEDLASGAIQLNVHSVLGAPTIIPVGGSATAEARCPSGEILTGGGYNVGLGELGGEHVHVFSNYPFFQEEVWIVQAQNEFEFQKVISAWALCIAPTP